MTSFAGKRAYIPRAARGTGRVIAARFLEDGIQPVMTEVNEEAVTAVAVERAPLVNGTGLLLDGGVRASLL